MEFKVSWFFLKGSFNSLSDNLTKWSNTFKQFVGKSRRIVCVFDHFVGLVLKGLRFWALFKLNSRHYSIFTPPQNGVIEMEHWHYMSVTVDVNVFIFNPLRMVKHTQTIRRLLPTNCLSVFDNFVGLPLKELNFHIVKYFIIAIISWRKRTPVFKILMDH